MFFAVYFLEILPKFSKFINSDDSIGKKTHQNLSDYKEFLIIFFLCFSSEKREIQIIVFIIMLTRSSERIFHPMRCTGIIYICIP